MNDVKVAITKERYDYLKSLSYADFKQALDIPVSWVCGYGWYGCKLVEENGEFFEVHTIGSSCD